MKTKKTVTMILTVLTLCLVLTACTSTNNNPASASPSQSETKLLAGVLEQNSLETSARKQWTEVKGNSTLSEKVKYTSFSTLNAMLMELNAGRVNYLQLPSSVANYLAATDNKLIVVEPKPVRLHYHMAGRAEDTALCEEMNSAIDKLKANGTLDQLVADYITNAKGAPTANKLTHKEGGETHIVAVTGDLPPLDYVSADGTPAGFNVALLNAVSELTGCNFEIVQLEASARLSALASGKVDMIFWIGCWSNDDYEPSEDGVCLTTPYFEEDICFVGYSKEIMEKVALLFQNKK